MAIKTKKHRFAPKLHIKTGDRVMVVAGNDKGKTGEVMQLFPAKNRAVVEGVRMMKKHVKATQTEEGGILKAEASIHISNLMHIDPKTGEPTRVGSKIVDGKKVRYSKKSGEII